MDKLLYIAASGAKQDLLGASVRANNLANALTSEPVIRSEARGGR